MIVDLSKLKHLNTLSQVTRALAEKGVETSFAVQGEGIAMDSGGPVYPPEEFQILEEFRFEGATNPADSSQLMVIRHQTGRTGMLIIAHGAKHSFNPGVIRRLNA